MYGTIFALVISLGLPLLLSFYAFYKKMAVPFLLGALAFFVSQVLLRIPILQVISENSASFHMFAVRQPILFAVVIGLSAGLFEEPARYAAMRFFMKERNWRAGFVFGAGHGGIEAALFVGLNALMMLFSPSAAAAYQTEFFAGGIERFFAMMLHIGLSIFVLVGVVRKNLLYLLLAILLHGFINALVGILPLYLPKDTALWVLEGIIAVFSAGVFGCSLWIKRKGVLP